MQEIIKAAERKHRVERTGEFNPGDTVAVALKIKEGDKERIQLFQGTVIQKRGAGTNATVTIRKSSGNVYVERVFPIHSPLVSEFKVIKKSRVRRAKLFFLRTRTGKSTRMKEDKQEKQS